MTRQRRVPSSLRCLLVTACLVALHLVAMAAVSWYLIIESVDDLGLKPGGHVGYGHSAGLDFVRVPIELTMPLILLEAAATLWRRSWLLALGAAAALGAALVHGWMTALVVGLRLWADDRPIARHEISDAIATGVSIGVAHVVALLASVALLAVLRGLIRTGRTRAAERLVRPMGSKAPRTIE